MLTNAMATIYFLAEDQYKKQQEYRCIESINFSTFYTTIPHEKIKTSLKEIYSQRILL